MMPLAPPLRSGGAADISALRFGDWKKPKPAPQIIMRQLMFRVEGSAGSVAISVSPGTESRHSEPAQDRRRVSV